MKTPIIGANCVFDTVSIEESYLSGHGEALVGAVGGHPHPDQAHAVRGDHLAPHHRRAAERREEVVKHCSLGLGGVTSPFNLHI